MSLIHYGESRIICDARPSIYNRITNAIESITCPDCLILVLKDVDETVEGWYDRDRSEYVTEPFRDSLSLFMGRSSQCRARGVALGKSGQLYIWTIRRTGHGDPITIRDRETRFLIQEWKSPGASLVSVGEGLWHMEGRYATGAEAHAFNLELTNANYRYPTIADAVVKLPTIIAESI